MQRQLCLVRGISTLQGEELHFADDSESKISNGELDQAFRGALNLLY